MLPKEVGRWDYYSTRFDNLSSTKNTSSGNMLLSDWKNAVIRQAVKLEI